MWLRRLLEWIVRLFEPSNTPQSRNEKSNASATASTASTVFYARIESDEPLRQSEILTGIIQRRRSLRSLNAEKPELEEVLHPYAVVLAQDCDLEQDYKARKNTSSQDSADKLIPNVLLTQAVTVSDLLPGLKGGDIRKRVRQNKDERYHVLQKVEATDDAAGLGLPALGVDFKRFFTIPTDELYAQIGSNAKRRTRLASPYLEHLTKRFADFQSRVALPEEHKVD